MFVEATSYQNSLNNSTVENKTDLILKHVELGQKLAWKLLNSWQARLPQEEVQSIVGISLCEAANNFDGRPNVQFQTFLFYYLRGRLLREITESVKARNFSIKSLNIDGNNISDGVLEDYLPDCFTAVETKNAENLLIESEDREVIEKSFSVLDSLEKEVIMRHYLEGQSLIDLAKELGYCRCHLSRVKARALAKLKKVVYSGPVNVADETSSSSSKTKALNPKEGYTGGRGRRKIAKNKKVYTAAKKGQLAA